MQRLKQILFSWVLGVLLFGITQAQERQLTVSLRGVYDSKITLKAFEGPSYGPALGVRNAVKNGEQVVFNLPADALPGEFLLRFDYRKDDASNPYPGELQLYLNKENITVHANPMYLRGDSLQLENDTENQAWFRFSEESARRQQMIGLLGQLVDNYDRRQSSVWKQAAAEYNQRVEELNRWIDSQVKENSNLYVSHLFRFSRIEPINRDVPPDRMLMEKAAHWFDDFDMNDTLVVRSRQMNQYMSAYLGLFQPYYTSEEMRDSMIVLAARMACRKASEGHPAVYGWMVDYFYTGFETYNIQPGIKMLEEHINNPLCLTSRKREIATRLQGMGKLKPGIQAPEITVQNVDGKDQIINFSRGEMDFHLLVFYDSECGHCNHLLKDLQQWYNVPENSVWMDIYTVALDNEQEKWISFHNEKAFPWTDMHAVGGVNSKAAADYYILSAPQMFVMNNNGQLEAMPASVEELNRFLHGEEDNQYTGEYINGK